ncbi:MAG: hypothetical protein A3J79_02415 [Elusimicrobia bacterium RIFOXYB2_FULL_62_6]|nr:MAG: hypothetical protein A3J79_02415 [Elusimicrobia bacterium RIFOXYB2_FULL_62_6]
MKTAIFALLLSPALLSAQGQERNDKMQEKSLKHSEAPYFTVTLPAGWEKKDSPFGLSAKEKKVFGVEVFGPAGADGIECTISVHYYAPGNLLHKTMEKYIKRHAQPVLGANLDAKQYAKVKDGSVAGYSAKLFERIVYEYLPPESIKQKKVAVYEHFAVVPAKAGFFVLKYHAQKEIAKGNIKAFEGVLGSFVRLVK